MHVLVTRPEVDAQRTARRVAALGHEAVVVPLLAVRRLPFAWPQDPIDAVVITSANAAAAAGDGPQLPLFAVGARTAATAREHGCGDVREGGGDATTLLATIAALGPPASSRRIRQPDAGWKPAVPVRLLYLAGVDRKPALEDGLRDGGYTLLVREVYEVAPVAVLPAELAQALAQRRIATALHYSRRSAGVFLRLTAEAGLGEAVAAMRHHCLSVDTAEPLRAAGLRQLTVAERPDEAALLATLPHARGRA